MPTVICLALRPRSLNAKTSAVYSDAISNAGRAGHIGVLLEGPLYSRIIWFHKYETSQGDSDNIAKRIHDALKNVVFSDDEGITHTLTIKVDATRNVEIVEDQGNLEAFLELSERLAEPDNRDVLYIEIGQQHSTQVHLGPVF